MRFTRRSYYDEQKNSDRHHRNRRHCPRPYGRLLQAGRRGNRGRVRPDSRQGGGLLPGIRPGERPLLHVPRGNAGCGNAGRRVRLHLQPAARRPHHLRAEQGRQCPAGKALLRHAGRGGRHDAGRKGQRQDSDHRLPAPVRQKYAADQADCGIRRAGAGVLHPDRRRPPSGHPRQRRQDHLH